MAARKKPTAHGRELTVNQANAAVLDAQGHRRADIARMVGVSERMVTEYRDDSAYKAQVAKLQERGVAELESFVERTREKLLRKADEAIDALAGMLHAVDSNGEPKDTVRFDAARLLLQHADSVGLKVAEEKAPGAVASSSVVIVRDERPHADEVIEVVPR